MEMRVLGVGCPRGLTTKMVTLTKIGEVLS